MKSTPTVFVVDDEEPIRHAFEVFLRAQGFPLRLFSSAEAFLQSYSNDWTGCLFADVQMPNMSGADLYTLLRKKESSLSIFLMTGHSSTESLKELLGEETVVLEKPFSAKRIKETVQLQWSKISAGYHRPAMADYGR